MADPEHVNRINEQADDDGRCGKQDVVDESRARCKPAPAPELGKIKNATNEKAKRVLDWAPRSREEAIVATAESLVRLGLLKDSPPKAA